ncbi:MAG: hypothetical protein HZA22_10715 [Nitrospirae bacterium]|nr:hypothetical protein [Nitrospirota bacterium]MBI5696543.1 hypothetical protein [Nitrospirota bacterium]
MKKDTEEKLERQPFDIRQKLTEMKDVSAGIREAVKEARPAEERLAEARLKVSMKEHIGNRLKSGYQTFSLKLKKTHSLGDFYGRFHPSKSRKGIKRSEG